MRSPDYEALKSLVHAEELGVDVSLDDVAGALDIGTQAAAAVLQRLTDDQLIEARFNRGDDQVLSAHVLRVTAAGHRAYEQGPMSPDSRVVPERSYMQSSDVSRIFISHASVDRSLAGALVQLLRLGTDLTRQQVFYTSGEGTGVPTGENFIDYIRNQLQNTVLVVQLVTPAFLRSGFCMCELGGVWVTQVESFPIIVPPVTYNDIRGILGNIQVERLDEHGTALDRLHDRVKARLQLIPDTASWNSERRQFLALLPDLLREVRNTHADASTAPSTRGGGAAIRYVILKHLAELHDKQALTSSILEPDLEAVAIDAGTSRDIVRRELARLLTEGLIEGFAESMNRGALEGECRITAEGLKTLSKWRPPE
ncbi:MAG: toll/interleukin-1 receptor domain-containing protein [Acidobacteria bacterium]|nr:toll/interleukin-1 receptor domain-containing protein [Acidobacteriota bacterium]